MSETLNYTLVESIEDLQCLSRGDLVKIIFEYEPKSKYSEIIEDGAYHGLAHNGALQFLVPRTMRENYLSMYRQRKSLIEFRNGAVVLNEDKSATESFSYENPMYKELNQTLIMAGLRQ